MKTVFYEIGTIVIEASLMLDLLFHEEAEVSTLEANAIGAFFFFRLIIPYCILTVVGYG